MEHIDKVGFELEGGWNGTPGLSPFPDISLTRDGSINGQALQGARAIAATHVGEAISPPIPITKEWDKWLLDHWPNADPPDRTNRTCGYHIHVSTINLKDYTLLSSKSFLFDLRDSLVEAGKELRIPEDSEFWPRMAGKNPFCLLNFDPARQMQVRKDGGIHQVRYGWLNFSWRAHGTLEFRALPTFESAELAVELTRRYFSFLNRWLDMNDQELVREVKF